MEKAFTIKEIAEITGKSDTTIYRYLKKGKIPFFTVEKDGQTIYKVKTVDLERFLGHTLEEDEKTFPHNAGNLAGCYFSGHNKAAIAVNEAYRRPGPLSTGEDGTGKHLLKGQS